MFGADSSDALPGEVYRDLLSTLFSMKLAIGGFGLLYAAVGALIFLKTSDAIVAILTIAVISVTAMRILLISAYRNAGGDAQQIGDLRRWESRYARLTHIFALLLAGLSVRALAMKEPMICICTVSLVFTFGAAIVSRNACRPRLCAISLALAVIPTALALLVKAMTMSAQPLHAELFAFEALLLLVVAGMSLGSVRHIYATTVVHLTSKQDFAKLARFDPLTNLPNRLRLRECYQTNQKASQEASAGLAVHYLDLVGFKRINDRYGHPAGDKLLLEVAERLRSVVRQVDVASQLGLP